jgi:hypothetical protein
MEKEDIKKQAKKIMDNFVKALQSVKIGEARVERKEDRRDEKDGEEADSDFRKITFENFRNKDIPDSAPKKSKECIEAEKGSWLE